MDDLALAWYIGHGSEAARERWAFAFSAKADWPPKVRSDIAKIVGTKRAYAKAFFVTNQAIPDRKRANEEDTLRNKHGIDVRILDRTWILDRVFKGGHEELAIQELGVTGLSRRELRKGPIDIAREDKLEEIEKRIGDALQAGRFGPALAEDALDAADLARNLERPRAEIDGRYVRANQLALKYGTPRQQVEAAYQWARTLFWWFEDYDTFAQQYSAVEARANGSRNVYDLERLTTLWYCLHGAVRNGILDAESTSYHTHTATLMAELGRLRNEKDRPSTALQAETLLLEIELIRRGTAKEPVDEVLRSFQDVILRSEGLVGYPLKPLVESITEIGQYLEGTVAYDDLFELIVKVVSNRDGEVSAARLLLTRGERQFHQSRPVDAIATLGRALGRLYKHETRHDIVRALYLCGCAYDDIGLPWAARGTLLAAASVATDELWRYGDVTPYQVACYRRLKLLELRLGRIPHILNWHELDTAVRYELVNRGYDSEALFAGEIAFEAMLARLLLRTDFLDLTALQNIPDALDRLGLNLAADALLYALGHKERLEDLAKELGEDPDTLASKWWNLTADIPLPNRPVLYNQRKVTLRSQVLGCRITVECVMGSPCVEVAESILAALESFLATTALNQAFAREPDLTMEIRTSDFASNLVSVSVEERAGRPHLVVICRSFDPHNIPVSDQLIAKEAIFQVVITALANTIMFENLERDLETLFRDERVSERAVGFTCTLGTQANVLGASPKTRLTSWLDDKAKIYPMQRTEPWHPKEANDNAAPYNIALPDSTQHTGHLPELPDPNRQSHHQIESVSLIRESLWNRAGWSGILFLTDPIHKYLPVFALVFRNREPAREIFTHLRNDLGAVDTKEQIRLTVVRGIDKLHPHAYRVIIGSNPTTLYKHNHFIGVYYRVHRMDATTPDNLDRFLKAYEVVGALHLAPAFAPPLFDRSQSPQVEMDLRIGIHQIHVRNAWEIGLNDIDSLSIRADDDPVIPDGADNAPVLELIRSRRSG